MTSSRRCSNSGWQFQSSVLRSSKSLKGLIFLSSIFILNSYLFCDNSYTIFCVSFNFLYHFTFSSIEQAFKYKVSVPVLMIRLSGPSNLIIICETLRWTLLWIWSVYEKFFVNSKIVFTPTRDVTLPKLQITFHFVWISNKNNRDYKNGRSVLFRITEEIRRKNSASKKRSEI